MAPQAPKLDNVLKPGAPLPPDDVMIAKALDILRHSAKGAELARFAATACIEIRILSTPQPTAYLPSATTACIGLNRNHPIGPSRFVLMLAGILREAQQESEGFKRPDPHSPSEEYIEASVARAEDKLWYMCTVACELNDQPAFTEYRFIDELGKMGYSDVVDMYLQQERG